MRKGENQISRILRMEMQLRMRKKSDARMRPEFVKKIEMMSIC